MRHRSILDLMGLCNEFHIIEVTKTLLENIFKTKISIGKKDKSSFEVKMILQCQYSHP